MATEGARRFPTTASLSNVLDAAMPEYFTENENQFLDVVRRGNIEEVKAYFEKWSNTKAEAGAEEDDGRETRLGNFALVLAAQNDNYDMVKYLLGRGYSIEKPHKRSCMCEECESTSGLMKTLNRLNTYRALASPTYMSLAFLAASSTEDAKGKTGKNDPVYRAFVLNGKLEKLALKEYEFKKDYQNLSRRCEDYAVSLLNLCHTMTEIECVMTMPLVKGMRHVLVKTANKDAKKLSVLNFAIKNQNEKFVAHPYSQLMLNSVLYTAFDKKWQERRFLTKTLFFFAYTILMPVWSIAYLATSGTVLHQKLSTPLAKFINHMSSFCWFLALLILSAMQDHLGIALNQVSPIDIMLALWVGGLMLEEIKEAYRQGKKRYFAQWWNIVTLIMLFFFVATGILWAVGTIAVTVQEGSFPTGAFVTRDSGFQFLLLSNSCFTIGFLLSFLHFSNVLQVNHTLGPLQISLLSMVEDISKFLVLFFCVFIAFAMAIRKAYSQYVQIVDTFHVQLQGPGGHTFESISGSFRNLFWALFDQADLSVFAITGKRFDITQNTGEILFAAYYVTAVLITLNMLIAMMANSYQKVADDVDIQWKLSRTRMWMQYVDKGSVLPPPFNLIPSYTMLPGLFRKCKEWCQNSKAKDEYDKLDLDDESIDREQRKEVLKILIDRYFKRAAKTRKLWVRALESTSPEGDEKDGVKPEPGTGKGFSSLLSRLQKT